MPAIILDVATLIDQAKSGPTAQSPGDMRLLLAASEKNKALVEPHRKLLEDNAALSFFGL